MANSKPPEIQKAIIDNLQSFLLELGKGFAFVGRQKRLQFDDDYFYFVAENLVLWARSESIGYAMNPAASGSGMMEYWNVGLRLVEPMQPTPRREC